MVTIGPMTKGSFKFLIIIKGSIVENKRSLEKRAESIIKNVFKDIQIKVESK